MLVWAGGGFARGGFGVGEDFAAVGVDELALEEVDGTAETWMGGRQAGLVWGRLGLVGREGGRDGGGITYPNHETRS